MPAPASLVGVGAFLLDLCSRAMHIQVLNKRNLSDAAPGVARVYVGRPSPLGNPFAMRGESTRSEVVEQYRTWLRSQWQSGGPAKDELLRLCALAKAQDLELVCWCAPKACHADVIRRAILAINSPIER